MLRVDRNHNRTIPSTSPSLSLPTIYLSWHAYPEVNLLALDIFMCGSARPQLALARIKDFWQPKTIDIQHMKRGTVASHKLPAEIASQLT